MRAGARNRAKFKFGKLGVGKAEGREVLKEWGSKLYENSGSDTASAIQLQCLKNHLRSFSHDKLAVAKFFGPKKQIVTPFRVRTWKKKIMYECT
jgi:hypothetical protein